MAYRVSQYTTENFSSSSRAYSTIVGIQIPFQGLTPSSSLYGTDAVFTSNFTTRDQIRSNIVNFLLTDQRERIFNPSFGANIRGQLFEQITSNTTDNLDLQIRSGVEQYFPNVTITELTFGGNPDENILTVRFSYTINNTGDSDNIVISLT
jgi:phage baseplate assembly protein W